MPENDQSGAEGRPSNKQSGGEYEGPGSQPEGTQGIGGGGGTITNRDIWHEVQEDEDVAIIGAMYGIKDWKLIWNHEENAELRKKRSSPHMLFKGDRVWIPKNELKEFEGETYKTHTFTLYPPKTVFETFLRDDRSRPYGNVKYEVWIHGKKYGEEEKRTREDGLVFEVVPTIKELELRVWFPDLKVEEEEAEEDEEGPIDEGEPELDPTADPWTDDYEEEEVEGQGEGDEASQGEGDSGPFEAIFFKLAHLDPLNTIEGIQDRLNNLGYSCGEEHGEIGEQTAAALREFQAEHGLPESGNVDFNKGTEDPTIEKLAELYDGSGGEGQAEGQQGERGAPVEAQA